MKRIRRGRKRRRTSAINFSTRTLIFKLESLKSGRNLKAREVRIPTATAAVAEAADEDDRKGQVGARAKVIVSSMKEGHATMTYQR